MLIKKKGAYTESVSIDPVSAAKPSNNRPR